MKRNSLLICCLLIAIFSNAQSPSYDFSASVSTGQTFNYRIIDPVNKHVEVTEASSSSIFTGQVVKIPSSIINSNNGLEYTVTRIGERAFEHQSLSTLILPETTQSIGDYAFANVRIDSIYLVVP